MLDNIHLHQILSATTPTSRVKPLEQKNGNMHKKDFKKSLKKEQDEDNDQDRQNETETSARKQKSGDVGQVILSRENRQPERTPATPGHGRSKRIDIIV